MAALGHEHFAVAGHDRGCGVAYRTALDFPPQVSALAVCDGVPYIEALERADARFASKWWHWFFLGNSPHAERVITADPLAWYRPDESQMGTGNYQDLTAAISDPRTVRAMIEDYRAGLAVDPVHDAADREAGRRIAAPTLVMWSRHDDMELLYGDPAAIWKPWCEQAVRTAVIDSGHHMAEEAPGQVAAALAAFLSGA
jgi:haloacetate dehalogenase